MISFPYFFSDTSENFFATSATISDSEERMEKTEDYHNRGKQLLPCLLSRLPSVGIHRFRSVIGADFQGFHLKIPAAFGESPGSGVFSKSGSWNTALGDCGGNIHFVPAEMCMSLVCREVIRQAIRIFHSCPDYGITAESDICIIPEHRIVPENISRGVKGNSSSAQVKRFFHFFRFRNHVWCHERGTNLPDIPAFIFQLNATHRKSFLF